jgi:hypothetical protein
LVIHHNDSIHFSKEPSPSAEALFLEGIPLYNQVKNTRNVVVIFHNLNLCCLRKHQFLMNVMKAETNSTKRKLPIKRILLWIIGVFIIIIAVVAIITYYNFNKLLTAALIKSFNSNIISDVYELQFEKLSVNFLAGNIKVFNVELQLREKPLHNYPYINSSFRLRTKKMNLENVELMTLIKSNILKLDKIEITEPDVELKLDGDPNILFPFKDTTEAEGHMKGSKKAIESFFLKEFGLADASFHVINSAKEREFRIQKLIILLKDLLIDQQPGKDLISYKSVSLSIEEFTGSLKKKAIKHISFKDFKITIDSLNIQQAIDTTIFNFADFSTSLKMLDIQTADSIFHLMMKSFNLSYKDHSIKLNDVLFKPNISQAEMQKRFTYSTTQFSGSVGTLNLVGLNFDSLIYSGKLFIDKIVLDKVSVSLFKDQRKPIDKNRFPPYLGQQIKAIHIPLLIKQVKATNVNLVNTELKPDGGYGKININRSTLDAKNITNLPSNEMLTVNADAYIENKAHANLTLGFNYKEPQFSINGTVKKFNLPDLNQFLQSYAPATIKRGTSDEITFSGNVYRTNSTGTMTFLYHDLEVDLALHDKAKWKSSVLSFAANTYLNASNPPSANLPPRIVHFHAERNMNKSFINILVKSILAGLKETMIMSKENKKDYKEAKKESKKEAKKEAKEAKKKARKEGKN